MRKRAYITSSTLLDRLTDYSQFGYSIVLDLYGRWIY